MSETYRPTWQLFSSTLEKNIRSYRIIFDVFVAGLYPPDISQIDENAFDAAEVSERSPSSLQNDSVEAADSDSELQVSEDEQSFCTPSTQAAESTVTGAATDEGTSWTPATCGTGPSTVKGNVPPSRFYN